MSEQRIGLASFCIVKSIKVALFDLQMPLSFVFSSFHSPSLSSHPATTTTLKPSYLYQRNGQQRGTRCRPEPVWQLPVASEHGRDLCQWSMGTWSASQVLWLFSWCFRTTSLCLLSAVWREFRYQCKHSSTATATTSSCCKQPPSEPSRLRLQPWTKPARSRWFWTGSSR